MAGGLIDADLGGHVVKKRVALPGQGKRGGARTIVATKLAERPLRLPKERTSEHRQGRIESIAGSRERPAARKSRILGEMHETALGPAWCGLDQQAAHGRVRGAVPSRRARNAAAIIKTLRENAHVSQAVFAAVLNTSVSTVHCRPPSMTTGSVAPQCC
jgi:DNA-binding transcriptional regulator YiaG